MAAGPIEYKFKIDAFTPETIPMERLGEYMAEVARLLANTSSVHFARLEKSSCVLVSEVEWEAAPKVRAHLQSVKRQEASNEDLKVVERLNDMLREDNAVGRLMHDEDGKTNDDFYFPGREVQLPQEVGPFNEHASVKAKLYRIGGEDKTAHAQLVDAAGRKWNGDLTQAQAAEMAAAGLYKWFQVDGTARWIRTEKGVWKLVSFHIEKFKPLADRSLDEDLEALRGVAGSEWRNMEDPLGHIEESRRDDDEVH